MPAKGAGRRDPGAAREKGLAVVVDAAVALPPACPLVHDAPDCLAVRVLTAQRAEVAADPHPEQLDGRLVVALDGQAEDAGDPATILELIGDGGELHPEDREREVPRGERPGRCIRRPVRSRLARSMSSISGADSSNRQRSVASKRRLGPCEGAVESVMVHSRSWCRGHLVPFQADYGRSFVPIHDGRSEEVVSGLPPCRPAARWRVRWRGMQPLAPIDRRPGMRCRTPR